MPTPRFRLDRQVTLAVIVTLAIQAAGGLLWAGRASARIDELERRAEGQGPTAERLARVEEQIAGLRLTLERLERRLESGEL